MEYKLKEVISLCPLEQVFPHHLKNLTDIILKDGYIKQPIIIENNYNIILDGSHKYVFLAMNGYKYAPVYEVDYSNQHIRVGSHRKHSISVEDYNATLSKEEIIRRGIIGNLFPPRTTRHIFPFKRPDINIPLEKLGKQEPMDVSSLIAKVDISEEINHNENYIKEIDEEIKEICNHLNDVDLIKEYLKEQIRRMKCEL